MAMNSVRNFFFAWGSVEEIRDIVGVPETASFFKNGDEISENEYRISCDLPLRFGHTNSNYIEDIRVIEKLPYYAILVPSTLYSGSIIEDSVYYGAGLGNSWMRKPTIKASDNH